MKTTDLNMAEQPLPPRHPTYAAHIPQNPPFPHVYARRPFRENPEGQRQAPHTANMPMHNGPVAPAPVAYNVPGNVRPVYVDSTVRSPVQANTPPSMTQHAPMQPVFRQPAQPPNRGAQYIQHLQDPRQMNHDKAAANVLNKQIKDYKQVANQMISCIDMAHKQTVQVQSKVNSTFSLAANMTIEPSSTLSNDPPNTLVQPGTRDPDRATDVPENIAKALTEKLDDVEKLMSNLEWTISAIERLQPYEYEFRNKVEIDQTNKKFPSIQELLIQPHIDLANSEGGEFSTEAKTFFQRNSTMDRMLYQASIMLRPENEGIPYLRPHNPFRGNPAEPIASSSSFSFIRHSRLTKQRRLHDTRSIHTLAFQIIDRMVYHLNDMNKQTTPDTKTIYDFERYSNLEILVTMQIQHVLVILFTFNVQRFTFDNLTVLGYSEVQTSEVSLTNAVATTSLTETSPARQLLRRVSQYEVFREIQVTLEALSLNLQCDPKGVENRQLRRSDLNTTDKLAEQTCSLGVNVICQFVQKIKVFEGLFTAAQTCATCGFILSKTKKVPATWVDFGKVVKKNVFYHRECVL